MSPLYSSLIASALTVVWLSPVYFDDPNPKNWTGQLVVGKKLPKDIKFGDNSSGKEIYFEFRGVYPQTVREDRGGWLRLFDGHKEGWADKDDFLLSRDAVSYFTKCINANGKDVFAWTSRAIAWSSCGEFENAIKDNTECIRLNPRDAAAFIRRGCAWHCKNDHDRAIEDLNEAIQLDPFSAFAFHNRGSLWCSKNDYDRAIDDYNEAIRIDPKKADTFYSRGLAWSSKKDYDRAIKDFDETIRLDPKDATTFYFRGVASYYKNDYDRAIKDFDEAIRLNPKFAKANYDRALVQMIRRRPESVDGFRTVLDLEGFKGELSAYSVIYGHLAARRFGNDEAAKSLLADSSGKLAEAWPDPLVQFLRGDLDEAALTILASDPEEQMVTRYVLGQVAALNGKKDEALAHFRWVKEKGNPADAQYLLAVAEVKDLERGKK